MHSFCNKSFWILISVQCQVFIPWNLGRFSEIIQKNHVSIEDTKSAYLRETKLGKEDIYTFVIETHELTTQQGDSACQR